MNTTAKTLLEVTPLSEHDCFYLVDRYKTQFDFPIHRHSEIELNFVENCNGRSRVVGDSVEMLGDYDLVLIGPGLEHAWVQDDNTPPAQMREITIQWDPKIISADLMTRTPFAPIRKMLESSHRGIAFDRTTIDKIRPLLLELLEPQESFHRFQKLWNIIYILAMSKDYRPLSTSSFANQQETENSRRIQKVKKYIADNYVHDLKLEKLAAMVGMTPTAFSRFFKTHTNQTLQSYIIDIRLGHAIRALVDSTMICSEICYSCGFNNLSNFNRLFKKKKGCTPMEFREKYNKNKIIV